MIDTAMFGYAFWVTMCAVFAGWCVLLFLGGAREECVSVYTIEDGWLVRHEEDRP